MRKLISYLTLSSLCLFSFVPLVWAQTATSDIQQPQKEEVRILDVQFSPARYYVGDPVELRFKFEVDASIEILTPPYEETSAYIIDNVNITRVGRDVSTIVYIRFFTPGTRSITFDFGGVKTGAIPLHVSSVLESDQKDLFVSYGPLVLPGTRLIMTLLVALIILLPAGIYFALKFIKRIIYHSTFVAPPYKKVIKELKNLSTDRSVITDKDFYTRLLGGFRTFLSLHFQVPEFHSATASRMATLLLDYYSEEDTEEIMTIIVRGDMVKFGGEMMAPNERIYCVKRFLQLVKQVEKVVGVND